MISTDVDRFHNATFTSVGGAAWLQGRQLIPCLVRHGSEVRGTVVDLGCGTSPFRPLFANAARYVRIDHRAVDPEVIVADATALPLEDKSVHCILLSQVIGDVQDIVKLFNELARVLAPGGRVLVYETIAYPQHDLPHDCWRVLPGGLKWAAGKAGLEVNELQHLGGYFTQLAMHWNIFLVGNLEAWRLTRPVAWLLRAGGNLACAGLDAIGPRPALATDYFACLVKRGAAAGPGGDRA